MSQVIERAAQILDCGRYRWWLSRSWPGEGNGKTVCFVMLNPSTADAEVDDPTIRRYMGFARAWGYSTLMVRNLFALRATDPKELLRADDPVGGMRGDSELRAAMTAHVTVAAWGARVPHDRETRALELLTGGALRGASLMCLGLTKYGKPRHPLYLRTDTTLIEWLRRKENDV